MENIRKLYQGVDILRDDSINKDKFASRGVKQTVKQSLTKTLLVAGMVMVFLMMVSSVSALDPRLNISFQEIVYRNATFAKNFTLDEEVQSCLIEGTINITNPSTETITDIYLKIDSLDLLTTDFHNSAGKNLTQVSGGSPIVATYTGVNNAVNDIDMGYQDIDNDRVVDYFWVNSTHFVFNISGENNNLIGVQLRNSSGAIDISGAGGANVPIEMTEEPITGIRNYGNVSITGVVDTNDDLTTNVVTINEVVQGPALLFIRELRNGNFSTVIYNMSCVTNDPPISINTTYSNDFTPGINRKVLAGHNWTIQQNVTTNNPAGKDVTNFEIRMTAQNVTWNGTEYNFTLEYLYGEGDFANVVGNNSNPRNWTWVPNGGSLTFGSNEYIKYRMIAPPSVPYSATYLALKEEIIYSIDTLFSDIELIEVNASADVNFDFEKRIYQPATNEDDHNVTWEIRPHLNTSIDIAYDVQKVTLWVTEDLNPLNDTSDTFWGLLEKNYTGAPLVELNKTTAWGSGINWRFNYTDGSSSAYPPPIVWMEPEWIIKNAYGQILNYSNARNGGDYYLKYIYVVNGYWLQINKNVTSIGEDKYAVDVYVENIGNGWTPENELVTVYDFIPNEFTPSDFTVDDAANQTVGTPGSSHYGRALQWNIQWKDGKNASLGPKVGDYAVNAGNYSWRLQYNVTGAGEYKASELYIVGLDPFKVDGASASPIITIIAGFQNYSNEIMYTAVVMFLIVINVANFVMTHNINKKIGDKLPPVPKAKSGKIKW